MRNPGTPLYYIATMIPADNEDRARIFLHQQDREGYGFQTIEAGRDIPAAIDNCDRRGTFLLDSVTALLANEMFISGGKIYPEAYLKITDDLAGLLKIINNIIIVSDFIYSDADIYNELTESYRRGLAYIDRQIAALCDIVIEACAGIYIVHKGLDVFNRLSHELD